MIDISINKFFTLLTGLSVASLSMFQVVLPIRNSEDNTEQQLETVIRNFVTAGDHRDSDQLGKLLHENFRVVANQLMGSASINVITKDQYLILIKEGKLGGDSRTVEIISLEVVNKSASAHVRLKGKALTFDTFYHLIQGTDGSWQLVEDLTYATKN